MLDRAIIDHASPTLARLKLGNLFNYPIRGEFRAELAGLQVLLGGKVYGDECAALKAFRRYEKCKAVYQRLFASGCPLSRLTVAAKTA